MRNIYDENLEIEERFNNIINRCVINNMIELKKEIDIFENIIKKHNNVILKNTYIKKKIEGEKKYISYLKKQINKKDSMLLKNEIKEIKKRRIQYKIFFNRELIIEKLKTFDTYSCIVDFILSCSQEENNDIKKIFNNNKELKEIMETRKELNHIISRLLNVYKDGVKQSDIIF